MGTRTFLVAAALAVTAFAPAQAVNSISGRVVGPDSPIHGAQISFVNTDITVSTNQHGEFNIEQVDPGEYQLHVIAMGYTPLDTTVALAPESRRIELKMVPAQVRGSVASSGR